MSAVTSERAKELANAIVREVNMIEGIPSQVARPEEIAQEIAAVIERYLEAWTWENYRSPCYHD